MSEFFLNVMTANAVDWDSATFRACLRLSFELGYRLSRGSARLDEWCATRGLKWWVNTRYDPEWTPYADEEALMAALTQRFEGGAHA